VENVLSDVKVPVQERGREEDPPVVRVIKNRAPSRRMKTLFDSLSISDAAKEYLGMSARDGGLLGAETLVMQPSFRIYSLPVWTARLTKDQILIEQVEANLNGDIFLLPRGWKLEKVGCFNSVVEQEMARAQKEMLLTAEQLKGSMGESYASSSVAIDHYMRMKHEPPPKRVSVGWDYTCTPEYMGKFRKREELPVYSVNDAVITNAFFKAQDVQEAVKTSTYDPLDLLDAKLVASVEEKLEGNQVISFQSWGTIVDEPPLDVRKPTPVARTSSLSFLPYVKR
jgi:hypothetical protein